MKKQIWIEVMVALLILLFLYTGVSKLLDIWLFKYDLTKQPFPVWLQSVLAWLIPVWEVLTAICLMIRPARLAGVYLSIIIMATFTAYSAAILSGLFASVPCGCGGVIRDLTWPQHLVFNIVFLGIAVMALRLIKKDNA